MTLHSFIVTQVEGIMDGLEVFFPFIPRKPQDSFVKYEDTAMYYEAEMEFKKAQGENADFEDNILKVCSHTYQCIIIILFFFLYYFVI